MRQAICSGLLISAVLVSSGCITGFVTQNYVPMMERTPFKATRPIAREIKFVYANGSIVGGIRIGSKANFLVATNLKDATEMNRRAMAHIELIYPDIKAKNLTNSAAVQEAVALHDPQFAQPARVAMAKVDAGDSITVSEAAAIQTFEMAKSFDNTVAMMNTSVMIIDIAATLAKKWNEDDARALVDWIHGTGAIGPGAPAHSVLHIDFIRAVKATSFQLSSRTEVIVSAYLERRGEEPLRSMRGVVLVVTGEEEPPPGLVLLNDARPDLDTTGLKMLSTVPFGIQLGVVAHEVIADLYKQLE